MTFGPKLGSARPDRGSWPALVLMLVAVLAPTACVLWFMSQAVDRQQEIARQRLAEAYRGQLLLFSDRLDRFWEKRASDLGRQARRESPAQLFEQTITSGMADSLIYLDADGAILYPEAAARLAHDLTEKRPEWREARGLEDQHESRTAAAAYERIAQGEKDDSIAARAWQAHIRCLAQSGDQAAAAQAIEQQFTKDRFRRASDWQGHIIAADEHLLLLNLLAREDRRYPAAALRLHSMIADYERWTLPAAQRLFLMEEMRTLKLGVEFTNFPTYEAESLARRFMDAERGRGGSPVIELSAVPDVWKLTSSDRRVVALYRTATVLAATQAVLNEPGSFAGSRVALIPPGATPARFDERAPAGSRLPGWQIGVQVESGGKFDAVARRQMASYLWVGFLAIATMAILALAGGQALRRQMRLANLKADLTAAVSHELKTPLASMRLLVDSLLEENEFNPAKTREYLELIARENSRLSRLIDNFLTFSRMERRREKFSFTEIRPREVIESALEAARERFDSSECQFEVEISPGLPTLHADENALMTALLNLLENAYKFTPQQKRIGVRAYSEPGRVFIAVEDNGAGIAPLEQKKIFRRFYQVDRQLARQTGGCGLGLSIVDFIVKAHHGEVQVKSQPGAGSTFTISLPCGGLGSGRTA